MRRAFELTVANGCDDRIAVRIVDGKIWLQIDSPWAGDGERGLGENLSVDISADEAEQVAAALLEMAAQLKGTP